MPKGESTSKPSDTAARRRTSSKLLIITTASWIRISVIVLVGFWVTPLLIETFGLELFGVLGLVAVSMQVTGPITGALSKVMTRELTLAYSARDGTQMRRVFTNGICLAVIASVIISFLFVGMWFIAPLLNVPDEHIGKVRFAIVAEGILLVQQVMCVPWDNLYTATHRMVGQNVYRTLRRSVDLIAILIVIVTPRVMDPFRDYILYRVIIRGALAAHRTIGIRRLVPDARFHRALVDRRQIRDMAGVGGWSSSNQVARFGFYGSDQFLLNLSHGLVYNALYNVMNTLRGYARLFGGNLVFGVEAVSADLQHHGRTKMQQRVMIATLKFTAAVTGWFVVIVGVFAGPFMHLWIGKRLEKHADKLLELGMTIDDAIIFVWKFVGIMLVGVLVSETHLAAANNLYGMGHIKKYSPAMLIAALVKVVVAGVLLLGFGLGPFSLAWVTLACLLGLYGVYFPILISRLCEIPMPELIRRAYLPPTIAIAPILAIGAAMMFVVESWNYINLLACIGALGALFAPLMLFVVAEKDERSRLYQIGSRMAGRMLGRRGAGDAGGRKGARRRAMAEQAALGAGVVAPAVAAAAEAAMDAEATARQAPDDDPSPSAAASANS